MNAEVNMRSAAKIKQELADASHCNVQLSKTAHRVEIWYSLRIVPVTARLARSTWQHNFNMGCCGIGISRTDTSTERASPA